MSAAASSANFHQNADTTVPLLEQFALDDYQPEEVKLEVALQLGPLGNCCTVLSLRVTSDTSGHVCS